jgi:hypothetical protein
MKLLIMHLPPYHYSDSFCIGTDNGSDRTRDEYLKICGRWNSNKPVSVAARSEAKALIAWSLRSWVRIPLQASIFALVFPCCGVLCR